MVYYVDSTSGKEHNDGLSPQNAINDYRKLQICPGDTVLFKRGTIYRYSLISSVNGTAEAPITYGAYGEGEKPQFLGSVNLNGRDKWSEKEKNIWVYNGSLDSQACNIIFNHGESCGVLAWEYEDLDKQGKWHYTHIGYNLDFPAELADKKPELYLYSEKNPAEYYNDIECAIYGKRSLLLGEKYIIFENLCLRNSGVHGYGQICPQHIVIRNCDFLFIGGCVWSRAHRIRFGNAIELWNYSNDILVEGCCFDNVYDSCFTHQGSPSDPRIPEHIYVINNTFKNFGMAAYEARDKVCIDGHFEYNTCIGAGLGFALQDEIPPRKSEIWPQPMGHHLFIWRMYEKTPGGLISVKGNKFYDAPYGACVYSTIMPEPESQFEFDDNLYYKNEDTYLIRWGGKNYGKGEFEKYQKESGQDMHSKVEKPKINA